MCENIYLFPSCLIFCLPSIIFSVVRFSFNMSSFCPILFLVFLSLLCALFLSLLFLPFYLFVIFVFPLCFMFLTFVTSWAASFIRTFFPFISLYSMHFSSFFALTALFVTSVYDSRLHKSIIFITVSEDSFFGRVTEPGELSLFVIS
jgi:hypothetical protein